MKQVNLGRIQWWQGALIIIGTLIFLIFVLYPREKPEQATTAWEKSHPATSTPTAPAAAPDAAAAETTEQARLRHDCENERYLAARRKLSDFTAEDFAALRACDQLGY
jgi:hypothetical protein